jgi:tRNA pseudouridine55 synthase
MPPFGLLNLNKPPGLSSRAAVDRVERLLRPGKVGHAGTLDPLATGVLVICVGQATRLIRFVQQMPKQYVATFLLGRHSATDDIEGEVSEIPDAPEPSRFDIDLVLPRFVGDIQQRPPAHSAIKVGGRRAYKLARKGAEFELAARTITIHRIDVIRYEYPTLELAIECGSGTYVRALGRDLAAALETSAVMSALERTAIGPFRVEDAVLPDELTSENLTRRLQPALLAVSNMPRTPITEAELNEIRNGRPISLPPAAANQTEWAGVDSTGELVAILHTKRGQLWPVHNFCV